MNRRQAILSAAAAVIGSQLPGVEKRVGLIEPPMYWPPNDTKTEVVDKVSLREVIVDAGGGLIAIMLPASQVERFCRLNRGSVVAFQSTLAPDPAGT